MSILFASHQTNFAFWKMHIPINTSHGSGAQPQFVDEDRNSKGHVPLPYVPCESVGG